MASSTATGLSSTTPSSRRMLMPPTCLPWKRSRPEVRMRPGLSRSVPTPRSLLGSRVLPFSPLNVR
eukprot:4919973-Lingulodinium_polyedra.AAC.1